MDAGSPFDSGLGLRLGFGLIRHARLWLAGRGWFLIYRRLARLHDARLASACLGSTGRGTCRLGFLRLGRCRLGRCRMGRCRLNIRRLGLLYLKPSLRFDRLGFNGIGFGRVGFDGNVRCFVDCGCRPCRRPDLGRRPDCSFRRRRFRPIDRTTAFCRCVIADRRLGRDSGRRILHLRAQFRLRLGREICLNGVFGLGGRFGLHAGVQFHDSFLLRSNVLFDSGSRRTGKGVRLYRNVHFHRSFLRRRGFDIARAINIHNRLLGNSLNFGSCGRLNRSRARVALFGNAIFG